MKTKIFLWVAIGVATGWGQSLRVGPGVNATWNQPARSASQPYRVEFWMHGVGPGPGNQADVINAGGVAFQVKWNGGSGLWLGATHRSVGAPCTILPSQYPNGFAVRYQYDPGPGSAGKETCEIYDPASGTRHGSEQFYTGSATNPFTNGLLYGQPNGEFSLGFLRIYSTLVAAASRVPLPTDPAGDLLDFTFNNSLNDRSGNGRHLSSGSPSYVPSPPPAVISRIRTPGAPGWTESLPCRAGFPCLLEGGGSYSTAEASGNLTYNWQQLSGPTAVRWSSRTEAQPSVDGMIFGSYRFRLQVTDTNGQSASSEIEVGAVATDEKGVVIHADPRVDKFLGPMIALGRNPWTWADERHLTGAGMRNVAYATPGFAQWQPGTVTWNRAGTCATTLAADLAASATVLTVVDASECDWSSLPTILEVGNSLFNEAVLICARNGNTLTVCPYGRGLNQTNNSYSAGAGVGQTKITGNGTSFLTSVCAAGPGPAGTVYEAGSVAVTNGSAAVTRVSGGTPWAVNGAADGRRMRIVDGGGDIFVANLGVSGASTGNLSKVWTGPTGTYAYKILNTDRHFLALEWDDPELPANPPSPNGNTMAWRLIGCGSDTAAYVTERFEAFGTGAVANKRYAYHDSIWLNGNGLGPNYYDEVLANYALHYRSGLSMPLAAARKLGRYWAKNPELMGGRVGGPPRAEALGGSFFAAVLDGQSEDWTILRRKVGTGWDTKPCNQDLREISYSQSYLALAALFDPDAAQRAVWKSELAKMYTFDNNCKGADNSYPTSYTSDQSGVDLTATNGSREVTGTNIPAGLCDTTAGTNGSIANGTTALAGAGFVPGGYIALAGTRGGQPWIQFEQMVYRSATAVTLGQPWQGDSCAGDCRWYVFGPSSQYFVVGGMYDRTKYAWPNVDPLLATPMQNNACERINSGLVRLAVPFTGATGSTYRYGKYNLLGNGTQVYMAGIKAYSMNYASKIDDPALAANYNALVRSLAQWILNTGVFDANDGVQSSAIYYARGFDDCEPAAIGTWHPYFCAPNFTLNGEVFAALVSAYQADNGLRDKIDRLYGSTWGKPGWTTGGVYTSPVDLTFPADVNFAYKYYGLMFGMGFPHQWPAARLGGASPVQPQDVSINFDLESVAGAASVRVAVTAPSGALSEAFCTTSPCTVTMDRRQGAHWVQIEYRNGAGQVLSRSEPDLVSVTQRLED